MPTVRMVVEVDLDFIPDAKLTEFANDIMFKDLDDAEQQALRPGYEEGDETPDGLSIDEYRMLVERDGFDHMSYADSIAEGLTNPDVVDAIFNGTDLDREIKASRLVSAELVT
jgi:hypothetical protein